ncbi:expressed protein [Phakopsora pachyrhizi]|uniref:Expressed protein n=1 Tax=Phakopsora pachyrhizi TaxID=170000 RepID=A0AAV0BTQ0_PHAPC|nr:expressed protein [Phakopsora pachyrhizi]
MYYMNRLAWKWGVFFLTEFQTLLIQDFNAHQRQAFCVYSGKGVNELRYYLAALYLSITSGNNRGRIGQPSLLNNGAMDDDHGNNLTLSAVPIGTNLSVFNSMPDPRTMAAAMAAARQQTNPQLYSYGNRRRELRLPERAGRVVLSDFLHQGPSANVNSAVISGNGQLLSLPSLPRQVSRRYIQANGDLQSLSDSGNQRGSALLSNRGETSGSMGASTMGGIGSREEQMSNHDRNEDGLLLTNGNGIGGLRSPIPLYSSPLRPRTPSALRERMTNDHDYLHHVTNSTPSSGRVSRAMAPESRGPESLGLSGSGPQTSHEARLGGGHSLTRRRSDIEMAVSLSNLSSHRHTMNAEASGTVDELRIRGIGSSTGAASRMNLDIPDRTDSVSPIDISDDERPPP